MDWNSGLARRHHHKHQQKSSSSSSTPAKMSSSIRRRLYHVLDVVLRVPPIFIMDSLFVNNMKLSQLYETFISSTVFDPQYRGGSPYAGHHPMQSAHPAVDPSDIHHNNSSTSDATIAAATTINYSSLLNSGIGGGGGKTGHEGGGGGGGGGDDLLLLISNTSSIFLVAAYAIGEQCPTILPRVFRVSKFVFPPPPSPSPHSSLHLLRPLSAYH